MKSLFNGSTYKNNALVKQIVAYGDHNKHKHTLKELISTHEELY